MPWTYNQRVGSLCHNSNFIEKGYSGAAPYKNDPTAQSIPFKGPIPRGAYNITHATHSKGPLTIVLEPKPATNTFGRSLFRIHGESKISPGNASQGCIIVGADTRSAIMESNDRELIVK